MNITPKDLKQIRANGPKIDDLEKNAKKLKLTRWVLLLLLP